VLGYWEHFGEHIDSLGTSWGYYLGTLWEHKNPNNIWNLTTTLTHPRKNSPTPQCFLSHLIIGFMEYLFLKWFVTFFGLG
jgi:hypothetical protein